MKIALECGFSGWPGPPRSPTFRIPKPFLIEFITASRRVRSNFLASASGLGIRVDDLNHLTTFALTFDLAGLRPSAPPLPVKAGLFEDLPDGVGTHLRQPISSPTQSSL